MNELRINDSSMTWEHFSWQDDLLMYDGVPLTGVVYNEFPNGSLEYEESYKDGLKDGEYREWHPNGRKKCEEIRDRGALHGKSTEWHENGNLRLVSEYEHGVRMKSSEWDPNGKLITTTEIDRNSELYSFVETIRQRKSGASGKAQG